MHKSDRFTMVLYLVNVLQPVMHDHLEKEFVRMLRPRYDRATRNRIRFDVVVDRLVANHLILKRKGSYSVTLQGLERIAALGLGRIRDKNRLFLLKELM